jgi:hypothetical protein
LAIAPVAQAASQAGGEPDLNARVTVLEGVVTTVRSLLTVLQAKISALETANTSLQTLVTGLQTGLATETQQRIAAQQALQLAIAQETTQRVAGDTALQSALNTEAGIRQSADQALGTRIDTANKIDAYFAAGPGGAIPDDDEFHELVSKTLPPGFYAVIASARVGQQFSNGDQLSATCELRSGATVVDRVRAWLYDASFGDEWEYSMIATVSLPSGGSLSVLCRESHDTPGVGGSARIMAIKVD